jgi:hypothetical protein
MGVSTSHRHRLTRLALHSYSNCGEPVPSRRSQVHSVTLVHCLVRMLRGSKYPSVPVGFESVDLKAKSFGEVPVEASSQALVTLVHISSNNITCFLIHHHINMYIIVIFVTRKPELTFEEW